MMMRLIQKLRGQPSCEHVLEALQSYLDGELSEAQAMKVAKHLKTCVDCDTESAAYAKIKTTLAEREVPIDPEVTKALEQFGLSLSNESS